MKHTVAALTLAALAMALPSFAQQFPLGEVSHGDVSIVFIGASTRPFPQWMNLPQSPAPEMHGVVILIRTANKETTAFRVTIEHEGSDSKNSALTFDRKKGVDYTWAPPFWIGEGRIASVTVEEVKSLSVTPFVF